MASGCIEIGRGRTRKLLSARLSSPLSNFGNADLIPPIRISGGTICGSRYSVAPLRGIGMTEYHLTIKELPASEQPRERLRDHGAAALSDAELLAILLRVGVAGTNVVQLAQ